MHPMPVVAETDVPGSETGSTREGTEGPSSSFAAPATVPGCCQLIPSAASSMPVT